MNNTFKFSARATAVAAVLALGSSAFAATAVDANIELDNNYRSGSAVAAADQGLSQGGRVEVNMSGKAGTALFVAGRASLIAKKDGTVATDDMWIQVGTATTGLKLGRFEAADMFGLAGDTLVNHAGAVAGTNVLRGRKDGSQFHAAVTSSLGNGLSVEVGVVDSKSGAKGIRPVVSYAAGGMSVSAALESGKYLSGNDVAGFGATAGYNFGAFTLAGNLAKGKSDAATRNGQTAYALTVAVGGLSAGLVSATNEAAVGDDKVTTMYASYSMPLFDIKGASVTPAISASTGKTGAGVETNENSMRVRLNYAF